tara:strand:+ start:671 stop:1414 length:744 start_codon:yes stop_codon:yes gene_type:complete
MAAETQVLVNNEKKYIAKFFSDASESDVKKVDLSTLTWAKHTLTLSGTATEKFKIGEVISTAAGHSAVGDGSEFFIVTGFAAGADTVEVVGWDYTNKKAIAIDDSCSNGDKIVGSVTGLHTETVANSGDLTEHDYEVLVTKLMWTTSGLQVGIEWDGSTAEKYIAELAGNGSWSMPGNEWPGIGINATGDSGDVLGDIQFSTAGHGGTDSYTIIMELKKQAPGYDVPNYELNARLGFPVDFKLGNFV